MSDPLPRTLDTARLELRLPALGDAPELVERWASDPETTRHLLFQTYRPGDFAAGEAFLGLCLGNWASGVGHRPWVIRERGGDGRAIGMIGVSPGTGAHAWEIGYVIGRAWWGRGYATEVVRALSSALLAEATVWRVFAPTHIDNSASQRVLAKAGFTREATLRRYHVFPNLGSEPQDCSLWALTR